MHVDVEMQNISKSNDDKKLLNATQPTANIKRFFPKDVPNSNKGEKQKHCSECSDGKVLPAEHSMLHRHMGYTHAVCTVSIYAIFFN